MDARRVVLFAAVAAAAVLLAQALITRGQDQGASETVTARNSEQAACDLGLRLLRRIARGYSPELSEDIVVVPAAPNYVGSFELNSHTGPWDYVQRVPLVIYGPRHVSDRGTSKAEADLADVYPTVGELLDVELPERDGRVLDDALKPSEGRPRLVVVLVWDGAGSNVLARWPERWPVLRAMAEKGISYANATVGSSPSITPSAHSTLGTGAWPRRHGVTAIQMRSQQGVKESFSGYDPGDLRLSTFADEVDRAFGNRSLVGLVGWQTWHLGMLGHGGAAPGGDADFVGIIRRGEEIVGNDAFYQTPSYLHDSFGLLRSHARQLDRADGRVDGKWLGNDILGVHQSPAWVRFETDLILRLWEREGFGDDVNPDVFLANYKMTDIAGHQFTMDSREMAEDVEAQDASLGRILSYLDRNVGDYVVIVTADHGHTPPPERTGAWPIDIDEVVRDLDRQFGIPASESLVQRTHATGLFIDHAVASDVGVTAAEMAAWLNGYTIEQNWTKESLPSGYEGRESEMIFSAVFPGGVIPSALQCAAARAEVAPAAP
jgi:arylsulfatase A-like enzyme